MKKKFLKTLLSLLIAGCTLGGIQNNQIQATTRKTKKVTVTKKAHYYEINYGIRDSYSIPKGKKIYIIGFKKIDGKKYAVLGGGQVGILVANTNYRNKKLNYKAKYYDPTDKDLSKTYKHPKKKIVYKEDHIVLPENYTVPNLDKGLRDDPMWFYKKAGKQGVKINKFTPESKADDVKVNPSKLTPEQQKELSLFAMRLINEARNQLEIAPLKYTEKAQNMANEVAKQYVKDGFSFGVYPREDMTPEEKLSNHDVPALKRAAQKYGLHISQNTIENGYSTMREPSTLTDMKQDIYNGIVCMLMGKNEGCIEFGHANGLLDADDVYDFYDDYGTGTTITDPKQKAKADEIASKEFAVSYSTSDDGAWNDYHFIAFNKYSDSDVPRPMP